ncbi:hypothetical protein A2U01_0052167, partial [Trifolium medium]|nr:hypothetical protein [Trifolium medium]
MARRRWFLMRTITAADVPDRKAAVRELLPSVQDVAALSTSRGKIVEN